MKKNWEKSYPYVLSIIPFALFVLFGSNFIENPNIDEALNALLMVASLVVGFIGAILPIILSARTDSRVIRHVFIQDKERLFLKYIKQTIFMGIILIMISVSLYFREQYEGSFYYEYGFAILTYVLFAFLLCTFRVLNNMLNLIFLNDQVLERDKKFDYQSEEEIELENSLKREKNKE